MSNRLLMIFLCLSVQLFATTRYVSTTGGNVSPYITAGNAATSIQSAIDVSSSGDSIQILDNGPYTPFNIQNKNNLTILPSAGQVPFIKGTISGAHCLIQSSSSITLRGLKITTIDFGLMVDHSKNIQLLNNKFVSNTYSGCQCDNATNVTFISNDSCDNIQSGFGTHNLCTNIQLKWNRIFKNSQNGLLLDLTSLCILSNNLFFNNAQHGVIVLGTCTNIMVGNNTIVSNILQGFHINNGARVVVLRNNIIAFNKDWGLYDENSLANINYNDICSNGPAKNLNYGNLTKGANDQENVDPLFASLDWTSPSYLHLTASSPMIGTGEGGVDKGAYSYGAAVPATPTGLTATPVSTVEIDVSWNNVSSETSYTLYRNSSSTTNGATKFGLAANQVTYNDTGLTPSTEYYYWVKAYNSYGASGLSAIASNKTLTPLSPPTTPVNLTAFAASYNQIDLTWKDVSNETSYTLYRNMVRNSNTGVTKAHVNANQTNYSDIGLVTNTKYYYWVKAFNSAGASVFSAIASNTTLPPPFPPLTPVGLTAVTISKSEIDVSWNNLTNESSYTLFMNTVRNSNTAFKIGRGQHQTNYQNTGLSASTSYFYWVRAYNISGASGFTAAVSNKTLTDTNTQPVKQLEKGLVIWNNVPKTGEKIIIYLTSPDPVLYSSETVDVKIYSLSGIFVRSVVSAPYSQLNHPIRFDPGFLSPGTYIMQAKGAGISEFKKIYIKK